jgi:hypothetical protein
MNNRNVIPEKFKWLFRQLIPNFGTILVVAVLLFASNVYAAPVGAGVTPSVINYQCTMTNASGIPLNGNIGMTFKLYAVQSGGTPLWTETHNAISFTNGLCNVSLGSITPIPASVWDSPTIYLGIKVAGDAAELAPRQIVGAVPYAMNATGTVVLPDNIVTTSKIVDGAVTRAKAPMLLGSLVSNQFIQTGSTSVNLQPGLNSPAGTTTFSTPFTSAPVVIGIDVSDNMANVALNLIVNTTSTGATWIVWSGHNSGVRQVVINWIAIGK